MQTTESLKCWKKGWETHQNKEGKGGNEKKKTSFKKSQMLHNIRNLEKWVTNRTRHKPYPTTLLTPWSKSLTLRHMKVWKSIKNTARWNPSSLLVCYSWPPIQPDIARCNLCLLLPAILWPCMLGQLRSSRVEEPAWMVEAMGCSEQGWV